MKKNEIYTGRAEKLLFPNKGIVMTPEGRVTVKGALPGQTVSFLLKKKRGDRMEGRLVEVISRAPWERESPCPHFGVCGGCLFQTLPYEKELALKEEQVRTLLTEALKKTGKDPARRDWFEGILPGSEPEGYRNKMEYSFGNLELGGELELGMHRTGRFNDVVTTDQCRIVDEDYRRIVRETRNFFRSRDIPFWRKATEKGYLRHFLVRKAKRTGEILIDLVTTSQMEPDLEAFVSMLTALPLEGTVVGILHTIQDGSGDAVNGEHTEILYGTDCFTEEILDLRFRITPFSFFQTNSCGAEVLYRKTREYVREAAGVEKPVIFDLYSGTGTIAQIAAPAAERVVGIELVEEAVNAARESARENGLGNVRFLSGDVLKTLDQVEEKPDLIILDPPRDGCAPKALGRILGYGVESLIYISCKITSLIRDFDSISAAGYRLARACGVDLFPRTANIETICLFRRNEKAES